MKLNEIDKPDSKLLRLLPKTPVQKGKRYVPTQFLLRFEYKGKPYAFHTLTKQCLETVIPNVIIGGEGYDDLISGSFFVPEGKDELAFYNSVYALMKLYWNREPGSDSYTILPTFGCNARCIYCYEKDMAKKVMSSKTAEQTIQYIISNHKRRKVKLSWFGGEPLLQPERIDQICSGIRKEGIDFHSTMVSNGSLITEEIIDKMRNNWRLSRIQISMDGNEADYIRRKRYKTYNNCYTAVIKSIDRMSEAGISVVIRCNIDLENLDQIPEALKDLEGSVKHKENVSIYFSPLNAARLSEADLTIWEAILEARPLIEKAGFRPLHIMENLSGIHITHCMADDGSVVIDPEGKLYLCEECLPESRIGDVFNGITNEKAKTDFCRKDIIRPKCADCPFLPDCTGFSTCPVEDRHCRQVHELITKDALIRNMIKKGI